jgi:hypothetical protein
VAPSCDGQGSAAGQSWFARAFAIRPSSFLGSQFECAACRPRVAGAYKILPSSFKICPSSFFSSFGSKTSQSRVAGAFKICPSSLFFGSFRGGAGESHVASAFEVLGGSFHFGVGSYLS